MDHRAMIQTVAAEEVGVETHHAEVEIEMTGRVMDIPDDTFFAL